MLYKKLFIWAIVTPILAVAQTENQGQEYSELEETIITASRQAAKNELDAETERLFSVAGAARDPLQAIYALPGVTFSNGFGASDPVIRGSAPQDNAYYIDLVPASYIFHLFGNSIFNKNLIHSFDLYPAAFPSEYGNATGGVIDVKLREPRVDDFTTTLSLGMLEASVMVESGIGDNQAFYASYRRSLIDMFTSEEDAGDEDKGVGVDQLPIADDYQFKYQWHVNDKHRLAFIAAGASDELAMTLSEGSNQVARDPDFSGPANIEQGFDSQGVQWDIETDDYQLTSSLTHIQDQQQFSFGRDQYENTLSDRYIAKLKYAQALNDQHWLNVGISVEDIRYDIDFNAKVVSCSDFDPGCSTLDADYIKYNDILKMRTYEFFIEDEYSFFEDQTLTLGMHYSDDNYLDETRMELRGRWNYHFAESWNTYIAAGQYSQLPELREMIDVVGNPDLTTIKADHYVWGVGQSLDFGWRWNVDLYYKNLSDIVISEQSYADGESGNYSNNADGRAYGVEFLLNKDITDNWYGWAAISLAHTERTNLNTGESVDFEYDKPLMFNLVLNRLVGEHWMFGIKWNYQSGSRYTPIVGLIPNTDDPDILEPVYGTLNSERLPDYHRLDFRAEYHKPLSWGYFKLYLDILNVYNRENVEGYDYAANGQDTIKTPPGFSDDVPVSQKTSLGFFPALGVEFQF